MSITDRLLSLVPEVLGKHRAALDATPALSSVQIIVHLGRKGPERKRIVVRTESEQDG